MPEPDDAPASEPIDLSKSRESPSGNERASRATEQAARFRHELDATPRRKMYRPTKKQAGVSFSGLILTVGLILNSAIRLHHDHHQPDDTAYLECIAQVQSDATIPTDPGNGTVNDPAAAAAAAAQAGIPTPDPEAAILQAESACDKYPH